MALLAKELRIGNFISQNDGGILRTVEVTLEILSHVQRRESMHLGGYGKIPLTEKWLIKFGIKEKFKNCYEPFPEVWWYSEK